MSPSPQHRPANHNTLSTTTRHSAPSDERHWPTSAALKPTRHFSHEEPIPFLFFRYTILSTEVFCPRPSPSLMAHHYSETSVRPSATPWPDQYIPQPSTSMALMARHYPSLSRFPPCVYSLIPHGQSERGYTASTPDHRTTAHFKYWMLFNYNPL